MGLGRRNQLALTFLAALALCTGLFVESFVPHTDDGCAVETHCLACSLALATLSLPAVALAVVARIDQVVQPVWAADEPLRAAAALPTLPSRAPPLV
jgi:hypothetical protein